MKWPWVSRKEYDALRASYLQMERTLEAVSDDRDYFRASYYDLRDIVTEQQEPAGLIHYRKLITGQLGDGPQ